MINNIIYKVYKMEKRLKHLENVCSPSMREDLGMLSKGTSVTFSSTVCSQSAKQALLVLAPANILLSTQNNENSAKGTLCVPLSRGVNSVKISCTAQEEDMRCILTTKIIELG